MWPNPQETVDLVTFTKGIYNGKHHVLCSEIKVRQVNYYKEKTIEMKRMKHSTTKAILIDAWYYFPNSAKKDQFLSVWYGILPIPKRVKKIDQKKQTMGTEELVSPVTNTDLFIMW